jgi:hypothetical protein
MFGLFKKRKIGRESEERAKTMERRAADIANRIVEWQSRIAENMNKRFGRYSAGKQKLILLLAGILMAGICLYRIISALSR